MLRMAYQTREGLSRLKNVRSSSYPSDLRIINFVCGQRLRREVKVWSKARHTNIVPLLGTVEDFPNTEPGTGLMSTGMVSPWMANGNLADYLTRNPTLVISNKLDMVRDITRSVPDTC